MSDFARVLAKDARSEAAREGHHLAADPSPAFRWADLDEQLRGALRRMASTAEGMAPLPVEGCGFTVAVELDEGGRAPIGVSIISFHLTCLTPSLCVICLSSKSVD